MRDAKRKRHVLIFGHRAYAAKGLTELMADDGLDVMCFSRGEKSTKDGRTIIGPVLEILNNPHFDKAYNVVINYMVLKYESIRQNEAFIRELLLFCRKHQVNHLIHISSMSVYPDSLRVITEESPIKKNPSSCGLYAGSKVVAEKYLMENAPPSLKLSFLRPAYIVAPDMPDPMGSIGYVSGEKIVCMGNAKRSRPLIPRTLLNQAVLYLTQHPPENSREVLLLVDPDSPTCYNYLEFCRRNFKIGAQVAAASSINWIVPVLMKDFKKNKKISLARWFNMIASRIIHQEYDVKQTEKRLGFSLKSDWEKSILV